MQWHVENAGGKTYLVAVNDGTQHETTRDMKLALADGTAVTITDKSLGYVLSGSTRRWEIALSGSALAPGAMLHLTAAGIAGRIDEQVPFHTAP